MTSDARNGSASAPPPRVWLLLAEKRGDNAQIRNLAELAGLAVTEKSIVVQQRWRKARPRIAASLDHIDRAASDPLESPWPALVITAGRRMASVALWIKQASGGHTRVVAVGKPRERLACFDLVVAASHYRVPEAANVARHAYPLMKLDRSALAKAANASSEQLGGLAMPLIAVFVGGETGGLRFAAEEAHALVAAVRARVESLGGSAYYVTSRRTDEGVERVLADAVAGDARSRLFVYDEAAAPGENPYSALLGVADRFVVTIDSLSMMMEAVLTGRPVDLFPLTRAGSALERGLEAVGLLRPIRPTRDPIPAGGVWARTLLALGRPIHSRDLTATARRLVEDGLAGWITEPETPRRPRENDDLERVVRRIHDLLGTRPGVAGSETGV